MALRICDMDVTVVYETAKALWKISVTTFPDLVARIRPEKLTLIRDSKMFTSLKRPKDDTGPATLLFRICK